jgi:hypothetical protein
VNHFVILEKEVQGLRVLSANDLPEIDPKGCFKTKPIVEGLHENYFLS